MRRFALLLALAAAPVLGGCTVLTTGITGGRALYVNHVRGREASPERVPLGTRVRIDRRSGPPILGWWDGLDPRVPPSGSPGDTATYRLVMDGQAVRIPSSDVVRFRRWPSAASLAMILPGMLFDAVIVGVVFHGIATSCIFDSC